jgi:dTDP-4-dehydrorhamnose reductase
MILLLGASGYVGRAYQSFFTRKEIAFRTAERARDGYLQRDGLRKLLREVRPDFLINAAGYVGRPNVDACEIHRAECLQGNAVFPGLLREVCEETATPWGHVSTGCLYLGARADGSGFSEEDEPNFTFRHNNASFYSGAKALGEELLRDALGCYVWRLRMPFHHLDHSRNYLTKLVTYERLVDLRNSLSQLDDFVRATWECWSRRLPFGIYNVTNPGSITTREVVGLIEKSKLGGRLAAQGKVFRYFADEAEFRASGVLAPRSSCVLDSGKLTRLGIGLDEVHDAIAQTLARWEGSA